MENLYKHDVVSVPATVMTETHPYNSAGSLVKLVCVS